MGCLEIEKIHISADVGLEFNGVAPIEAKFMY